MIHTGVIIDIEKNGKAFYMITVKTKCGYFKNSLFQNDAMSICDNHYTQNYKTLLNSLVDYTKNSDMCKITKIYN